MALLRSVILIDEAQEMNPQVLNELRIMASYDLDSKTILTVIFCGDNRLPEKFKSPDLIPLGSRIRTRLNQESISKCDMIEILKQSISLAGNSELLITGLIEMLCDHLAGNLRVLMSMADNLLAEASMKKLLQLDEKLFFEVFDIKTKNKRSSQ
jgi:type II secretory pathway predicted ATPase ExeA